MSVPPAWQECLDFFGLPIVLAPSQGQLSGDAGLLPIRQFDEDIGLTRAVADALDAPRDPVLTEHTFLEMARSRISVWRCLDGRSWRVDDGPGQLLLAATDAVMRTAHFSPVAEPMPRVPRPPPPPPGRGRARP